MPTEPLSDKPPTNELGSSAGYTGLSFPGLPQMNWASIVGGADDLERVPELQWPLSPATYHSMMNDAQIYSLMQGLTLPIRAYRWYLEPNGALPASVERISADYNLPIGIEGEFNRRRAQRRFSFDKHLEDALRALVYGFYYFEQVGEIADDGLWHLRKLGIRAPRSLTEGEIVVARDGSLEYIKQATGPDAPRIPINRLVCYVWDREGSNWTGRSMLRSVYRNHVVKDRVLRVGAINIERAGGVPYVNAPAGASGEQIRELDALARTFRVGEGAGAALPHGAQLKFAAATGGDGAVAYIKQQNEEMARSFLQMVNMLGQTNSGSRALGDTFHTIVQIAQFTIAKWFADTFNEHVIEDDVEWNEGPLQEYAPLLKFDGGAQDPMAGFREAVDEDEGIMVEDPEVRASLGVGPTRSNRRRAARGGSTSSGGSGGVIVANQASPVSLPPRPLRRQPYQHEIEAQADFANIDSLFESALFNLVNEVRMTQSFQIDELHDAIVGAKGDVRAVSSLSTSVSLSTRIRQHLELVALIAMDQAVQEAQRQGVDVPRQSIDDLADSLTARAEAIDNLIRQDIEQSATREAVRLTGGGLSANEVADQTRTFLNERTAAAAKDILAGAIQSSMNEARNLVFQRDGEDGTLYASEILDTNTCSKCIAIDGTQYETIADAVRDYPTGHYKSCDGRERCRGMVVKVYARDRETVSEPAL